MDALRQIDGWPCTNAAVAVVGAADAVYGQVERPFAWASVTKIATAVAALVAVEEGVVDLDEPAGPEGSTVRHLLAHASGLGMDDATVLARPGERRVYSNAGFELLAATVAHRGGIPFARYFEEVWGFPLAGSPAHGVTATIEELRTVAHELLVPRRLAPETLAEAATVQFPGLDGVLPGFGRMSPNDWGLGLEVRDGKAPHWTGARNSAATFGHFGRAGGFLWVDPEAGIALACLTDLDFGDWAKDAWPRLSDAVLSSLS